MSNTWTCFPGKSLHVRAGGSSWARTHVSIPSPPPPFQSHSRKPSAVSEPSKVLSWISTEHRPCSWMKSLDLSPLYQCMVLSLISCICPVRYAVHCPSMSVTTFHLPGRDFSSNMRVAGKQCRLPMLDTITNRQLGI